MRADELYNQKMHKFWIAGLLVVVTLPAYPQDRVIDVAPCGFSCKVMRNVTGHPVVVEGQAVDDGSPSGPVPSATDGADKPEPSSVVSQRGVLIVQTPAERAAIRRQRRALEREITLGTANAKQLVRRVLGASVLAPDRP